ncbi:ATP-binding cassette domain-containing protein [Sinomonas sp. P47F7]|uniref:ATP-binding cassette domain-containing protein n=1 Tax=Sinomonas sp. P47F7 TaxID=3410987 RepID=UPI003BF60E9B
MLEIRGLRASYPGFALGPVTATVHTGEFATLVGTNGSGKSTLLRSILGLQKLDGGAATWDGLPLPERNPALLSLIGYVSDSPKDVLPEFTAHEYWSYCRIAHERARRERLDAAMDRAGFLAERLDFPLGQKSPLGALSLGTTRKAQIVGALLAEPELVVLDEPFIGLDFIAARALESLLRELVAGGTTVLASSHDLDLTSRVADQLIVLHAGSIVLDRPVPELGGSEGLEPAIVEALRLHRGATLP